MDLPETQQNLIQRLLKSSSIYALSGIIRNLVGFIMLPIYTQYLSPKDYGIVALMVFTISMIEITLGARMGHAPQKFYHDYKSKEDKLKVIATALFTTVTVSIFITSIAVLNSEKIAELLFSDPELKAVVALFLVLISTQAVEFIGLIFIRIQNRYRLFFALSMFKLVIQLSANIALIVYLDLGVIGMATATAFSSVVFAGVVLLYVIRCTGFTYSLEFAKKMLLFTAPLWLSSLISLYIGSSHLYVMKIYASLSDIGLYSIAEKLAAIISSLLFTPFFNYWSAERFRLKDRADFDDIHRRIYSVTFIFLFAAGAGIALFSQFLIGILTSDEFHSAFAAVPFVVFGYVLSSMAQFYHFSFLHKAKTGEMSKIMYRAAIVTTLANFALIPFFGFIGAAISVLVSNLALLLYSHFRSKQYYDSGFPLAKLLLSLTVLGSVLLLQYVININSSTLMGFGVSLFFWIICCTLLLRLNFTFPEMKRMIQTLKTKTS